MKTRVTLYLLIMMVLVLGMLIGAAVTMAQEPTGVDRGPSATRAEPAAVGVDPFIYEQLAESRDGKVDFFVAFRDTADLAPAYSMGWSERGRFVVNELQAAAERSQVDVKAWLEERGIRFTSFWIDNTIFLHADEATLNALAAFPEVAGFRGNHVYEIMPVETEGQVEGSSRTPAYPWNIQFPMADQVHSVFGIKGQGVVLGGMDTGVEYTHMGLVNNYRGNLGGGNFDHTYSWYDPSNSCGGAPCDTDGHGTATHGIMAGDDDPALPDGAWIGMAPDAQWIHCLGCPYGSCPQFDTTACAQWFLAPGGDPDLRPVVVNHSWGLWSPNDCNGNAFQAELMAYRAADIVPAFAAGNVGDWVVPPHCWASTSPANNTDPDGNPIAFSSGAHGTTGVLDYYSSGGPSACNNDNLFPDVTSPGQGSCTTQLGNSYYCGFGGTSSASPHTAGCVALVRSANPTLTVDAVEQIIRDAANDVDDGCGTPPESPDWNNKYGEGHLDCYEAVEMASVGTGTLDGHVYDLNTSDPLGDAVIDATLSPTQTWQTTTDDQGYYEMTILSGTYSVEASRFGYFPVTISPVDVVSGSVTTVDFYLEPAPSALVHGYVTDANTGWPLYASINIAGYPDNPVWTDPATGYYEVTLPEGSTYNFTVEAWVVGYLPLSASVGPVIGDTPADFALDADLDACIAPGYEPDVVYSQDLESDNGGFSTYGTNSTWQWGAPTSGPGSAHSGVNVWATNLAGNYVDNENSYVESPDIDLSPFAGSGFSLSWWQWLQTESCCDYGEVQVSNDGGTSWTTVYGPAYGNIDMSWNQRAVLLDSSFAVSNFRVRFHLYTDGSVIYPGWYVDDIGISGNCQPQAGGLVVGHVYDLNTSDPMDGADVWNDAGEATLTSDGGFYTLFSPPGLHDFWATKDGYGTDTANLDIVDGTTTGQDFWLGAGYLEFTPTSLQATLDMGTDLVVPATLANTGTADAFFEMQEIDRGSTPVIAVVQSLPAYTGPSDGRTYSGRDYDVPSEPSISAPPVPERYESLTGLIYYGDRPTFDVDNPGLPVEDFENTLVPDYSIVACPGPFDSNTNNACFAPGGILEGIQLMNSNPANDMVVIGDGALGSHTALVGPNTFVDDHDIIFLDGGVNAVGLDLYSPLVPGTYDIYIYGPGDILLGQTTSFADANGVFWGVYSGALPITRIRTVSPTGDGELFDNIAFGISVADVPWLSEDPVSGTVPLQDSVDINVTFDAGVPEITQPGDYFATLRISNDTVYGPLQVPVTLTVIAPDTYGKLRGWLHGLGYCDADYYPLEQAEVVVEGNSGMTWTLQTDAGGYYQIWVDETESPLVATVTYPEHETGYAAGIIVQGQQTTTVDFDLRWLRPCISVAPDSLSASLGMGEIETQQVTLTNDGAAEANFEMQEVDRGFVPTLVSTLPVVVPTAPASAVHSTDVTAFPVVPTAPSQTAGTGALLIQDHDAWGYPAMTTVLSNNGIPYDIINSNQIATWDFAPYKMIIIPSEQGSTYFTYFNNDLAKFESFVDAGGLMLMSFCTQGEVPPIAIPFGGTNNFDGQDYNYIIDPAHPIFAGVPNPYWGSWASHNSLADLLPDDRVLVTTGSMPGGNPVMIERDHGAGMLVAGGQTFEFGWGNGQDAGIILENMIPYYYFVWQPGGDVPWLSEDPISGTVPIDGGMVDVDVTFDAGTVPQPGEYYATLNVSSDDPENGTIGLPVTLTVTAPDTWGKLTGVVSGMGYCDDESYPLEGAAVAIEGGITVTSDADGVYVVWLEEGTYTVTASAEDHTSTSAVVTITGQQTTTQDLDLRSIQPCMSITPGSMSVVLESGDSWTEMLTLVNDGAGASEFSIRETTQTLSLLDVATGQVYTRDEVKVDEAVEGGAWPLGSGGPDPYGYTYMDSNEVGGPVYEWIEIAPPAGGSGIPLGLNGVDDGYYWPLALPFPLNFYGVDYTQMAVATNGTLYFEDWYLGFGNNCLPDTSYGVYNYIAHFWDDLYVSPGEIYYEDMGNMFVIEYYQVGRCCVSPESANWEIILFDNGSILFQYQDVTFGDYGDYGASATVGIQGYGVDPSYYLEYSCETASLSEELAICFAYPGTPPNCAGGDVKWLSEDPTEGMVAPDSAFDVEVTFTALPTLPLGIYTATLIVDTDDAVNSQFQVPVQLEIVEEYITPTASFESNSPVCLGETTVFTNTSIPGIPPKNAEGQVLETTYLWDFGDGETSTEFEPTHDYAAAGTYDVTLQACNRVGMCDTYADTVEVLPWPQAGFTYEVSVLDVTFTNTSLDALSYEWDFGDGTASTDENPVHTYADGGTYTVVLTATNDCAIDVYSAQVEVIGLYYYYLPLIHKNYE